MTIKEKLNLLPENPGVYVMLNDKGQIIYIGKAKVLKNRVRQYFHSSEKPVKVQAMVDSIADFYYIITESEADAFLLEANLIKKHKPRYNILLKDDKAYPYIKIDLKKRFPYFEIVRRVEKDGAKYFGPYIGGINARDLLEIVISCFCIRECKHNLLCKMRIKECLNYHIKRCKAPCNNRITDEEYKENVLKAIDFLNGEDEIASKILKEKMQRAIEVEDFEYAITMRENLKMLEKINSKRVTDLNRFVDADILAVGDNKVISAVSLLIIRKGKMQGARNFNLGDSVLSGTGLEDFIPAYYSDLIDLPSEIVVNDETLNLQMIEEFFAKRFEKKVEVKVAKRGKMASLLEMAEKNCKDFLEKNVDKDKMEWQRTLGAIEELKEKVGLKTIPMRMECYDISNISGTDKVGSMVVFIGGKKEGKEYRRFRIKTVKGSNDFMSLQEVLRRRLTKLEGEEVKHFPKPDLIIIDGGKGQLSSVKEIFDEMKIEGIELISLAKKEELIYTLFSDEPIALPHDSYALQLMQRIRDESHRFAITYHRTLRDKKITKSALDDIEGVGKIKKSNLLKKFKSVEGIKKADLIDVANVSGIGMTLARKIKDELGKKENEVRSDNN